MIQESAADDEGVGEVKARHRSQLIDVLASHPDRLGLVLSYGIVEAEGGGQ